MRNEERSQLLLIGIPTVCCKTCSMLSEFFFIQIRINDLTAITLLEKYIYIFSFQISKYSTESLILKIVLQFMDCDLQYFGNLDNASRRKVFWINMKIQLSNLFHKSFHSFHAWPFYAKKDFLNEICEIFVVFKQQTSLYFVHLLQLFLQISRYMDALSFTREFVSHENLRSL